MVDREVTLRRFKKGELAYKETLIGGCTKVGACDQAALNWLDADCLAAGCRNLAGNLPKLERVISAQERLVGALGQGSTEYHSEKADLAVLVAARDKALQQQKGTA